MEFLPLVRLFSEEKNLNPLNSSYWNSVYFLRVCVKLTKCAIRAWFELRVHDSRIFKIGERFIKKKIVLAARKLRTFLNFFVESESIKWNGETNFVVPFLSFFLRIALPLFFLQYILVSYVRYGLKRRPGVSMLSLTQFEGSGPWLTWQGSLYYKRVENNLVLEAEETSPDASSIQVIRKVEEHLTWHDCSLTNYTERRQVDMEVLQYYLSSLPP